MFTVKAASLFEIPLNIVGELTQDVSPAAQLVSGGVMARYAASPLSGQGGSGSSQQGVSIKCVPLIGCVGRLE